MAFPSKVSALFSIKPKNPKSESADSVEISVTFSG
jgi:hypothetical protein